MTQGKKAKKPSSTVDQRKSMFHVFDTMSDGVCIINEQCKFEYINPSLIKEFGPVQGRDCTTYFSDTSTHCPWCKNNVVATGKTIHWEWYSEKNNKTYEVIDAPFISPDNRMTKLEIFHDISEQKKHQTEIQEMQEKLTHLLEERTSELDKTSKDLTSETIERKKAQDDALTTKEYLQNIIDSAPEIIISFDTKGRVMSWNKSTEALTGYNRKEVLNRPVEKIQMFITTPNIISIVQKNCKDYTTEDLIILTKNNTKKILRVSGSPIHTHDSTCIGSLFIGRDITMDVEAHGKLMVGNMYLLPSETTQVIIHLYTDLVTSGYKGFFITRSHIETGSSLAVLPNSHIVFFSEENIPGSQTLANPDDLVKFVMEIEKKHENALIVLDGFHYFLTKFSFPICINALYHLNDFIRNKNIIVVLRVHPSTVDTNQMGVLESEFQLLPSQKLDGLILEDELTRMLRFIYEQNTNNALVSINKIMSHFDIVYLTASKRIAELVEKDLIFTKRQGKLKTVYISEKGKSLLMKRSSL